MARTFELVRAQNLQDALHFIARIHDDRLVRLRIAQNRAIALQHPHWNNFVNQFFAHIESIATLSVTLHFPISAASSSGRCKTFPCSDSTILARESHLFGCIRSKPPKGIGPVNLTLASDFSFCFQCQMGSSLVLRGPIETTASIRTAATSCPLSLTCLRPQPKISAKCWIPGHSSGKQFRITASLKSWVAEGWASSTKLKTRASIAPSA